MFHILMVNDLDLVLTNYLVIVYDQACAATTAKMATALAAPLFFNMMTTRAAKVLPEEEALCLLHVLSKKS